MKKNLFEGLNKHKAKIQRKNKDYKRQLSEISGKGLNKSGHIGESKQHEDKSFLEKSGISNFSSKNLYS